MESANVDSTQMRQRQSSVRVRSDFGANEKRKGEQVVEGYWYNKGERRLGNE